MTALALDHTHTRAPRILSLATLAAALIAGSIAVGLVELALMSKAELAAHHPPPGSLIDVGGYHLHLNCTGEGSGPTVLLESGNAEFSLHWSAVQSQLAQHARVCSYDRAGLGWSEKSDTPRTIPAMTAELHTLLQRGDVPGPYILVGHSFGGLLTRDFAATYPGGVAGLVLVDAAHEDQVARVSAFAQAIEQTAGQFESVAPLAASGILAVLPGNIPDPGLSDSALASYRAVLATGGYFDAAAAETRALAGNLAAFERTGLGDLPLIVISRGQQSPLPGMNAAAAMDYEAEWQQMQEELLGLSSRSTQIVAASSGHAIQLDEPELVVSAVRQIASGGSL